LASNIQTTKNLDEPASYQEPELPDQEVEETQKSDLVQQYEETQKQAQQEFDEEKAAIAATNPHTMFKDIVTHPTKRGIYPLTICGRPIDLSKLENYMVFKVSPRTTTTLLRYNDMKANEEALAYGHNRMMQPKSKKKFMWILIIAVIIIIALGLIFLTQGDKIMQMFSGFLGGMGGGGQQPPPAT